MALARALSSLRASVLSRVSIPIPVHGSSWQTAGTRPSLGFLRGFAEGTYLDKAEVEERVVKAIKNFDKVDPSKVRGSLCAAGEHGRLAGACKRSWSGLCGPTT